MPLPKSAELFYGLKLTDEQKIYANSCYDNLFTGCQAVAGSGKTTIAVGVARQLFDQTKRELHYIFPTVEEKALGYSQGSVKAKEAKYLTALYDALTEIKENPSQSIIDPENMRQLKEGKGWVHAYSHNYMRGGNIKNATVIIDEAQNLTKKEVRKILTRIHDSCHVIMIGDYNQCDIKPNQSGFLPYLMHYEGQTYALICKLSKNFRGLISSHAETIQM